MHFLHKFHFLLLRRFFLDFHCRKLSVDEFAVIECLLHVVGRITVRFLLVTIDDQISKNDATCRDDGYWCFSFGRY